MSLSTCRRAGLLVACLGTLALAAPAQGASPVLVLDGSPEAEKPAVAVAPNGTAHVVWERRVDSGDEIHYCRLPRGAKACDRQQTWVPDNANTFGITNALVREDGRVQLIVGRCCFPDEQTLLLESADGGTSFAAPRQIGTGQGLDAIGGPGPNAITATSGGAASGAQVSVQVMATDAGITSAEAQLEDGEARWYPGGVGLLDSSTPIFAYGDLTSTFIRRYDATQPNFNDGASWLPSTTIPNENEARLVTGSAGTYVMTHIRPGGDDAYQVRRISQKDGSLSAPVAASDVGDPIFGTLAADGGGGLISLWTVPGGDKPIYARSAPSGGAFSGTSTLVAATNAFNLKAAMAPDHGGFVVWDGNTSSSANSSGVRAAAIPAGGPKADGGGGSGGTKGCTTEDKTIKTGVKAIVSNGCWNDLKNGRFDTTGDVNVNGVVFATDGKTTKVTIDTAKHRISASKGVVEKAGSIVLAKDAIDWDLDAGPKTFTGLGSAGPGGKAILLFDFPVVGEADVTFVPGAAKIGVSLQLPKPFDVITGRAILTTTAAGGLKRDGITIHVENATIGPFLIRTLDVTYDGDLSLFSGKGKITIPPEGGEIDAGFAFRNGKLEAINASVIGVTPLPFAITPSLWLKSIGFSYSNAGGFRLGGGAQVGFPTASGPFVLDALGDPPGTGAGFSFFIPSGKSYAEMSLKARLKVFGLDVAGASATFQTTGKLWFDGDVSIGVPGVVGVFGAVHGDFNLPQKQFVASGSVSACVLLCVQADAIASNLGIAVCPKIEFGLSPFSFTLQFLVGYRWKDGLDVGLGCNQGPYQPANAGPAPGADDVGSKADVTLKAANEVQLPPDLGDPYTIGMEIRGNGGIPGVRIVDVATGNTVVESDPDDPTKPVQGSNVVMVPNASSSSVRLVILRTGSGDLVPDVWRIEQSGGAPISFRRAVVRHTGPRGAAVRATVSGISFARAYDATKVTAKLGGRGRARSVAYTATNLGASGRSVQFVEVGGDGVAKVLGTTKKAKGTLRFTVFDGPAGTRRVEARVLNASGLPVGTQTVARYRAPGPLLPTKATRIALKRDAKSRLKITWKGTARADRRVVEVAVADGRRLRFFVKSQTVTVPGVAKRERVTVTIRGLTRNGLRGPKATARR